MFCLCYNFLCVLYTLAYVWCNDHVNSCLHIDIFIECRPHIRQNIHRTPKVGTFVEQRSDFSCVMLQPRDFYQLWSNSCLNCKGAYNMVPLKKCKMYSWLDIPQYFGAISLFAVSARFSISPFAVEATKSVTKIRPGILGQGSEWYCLCVTTN